MPQFHQRIVPYLIGIAIGCAAGVGAQTRELPDRSRFEAASVKIAADPLRKGSMRGGPGTSDPGMLTVESFPLSRLVMSAYSLKDFEYRGPAWMDSALYDVVAKIPKGASEEDVRLMMRNLLTEKFALAVHREKSQNPGYDLEVAKGGSKLKMSPNQPDHKPATGAVFPPGNLTSGPDGFPELSDDYVRVFGAVTVTQGASAKTVARGESMTKFAQHLTQKLHVAVVDKTGLGGNYDFELIWAVETPAQNRADAPPAADTAASLPSGPLIFQALEKLGLRLTRAEAGSVLVVDRAEKTPIEN